ncbi:MAG: hypothetical protein QM487_02550 [Candidatus Marithrix sp.]
MTQLTVELMEFEYQYLLKTAVKCNKSVQVLIREWINQLPELEESYDVTQDSIFNMEGYDSNAPTDLSINPDKYIYPK